MDISICQLFPHQHEKLFFDEFLLKNEKLSTYGLVELLSLLFVPSTLGPSVLALSLQPKARFEGHSFRVRELNLIGQELRSSPLTQVVVVVIFNQLMGIPAAMIAYGGLETDLRYVPDWSTAALQFLFTMLLYDAIFYHSHRSTS